MEARFERSAHSSRIFVSALHSWIRTVTWSGILLNKLYRPMVLSLYSWEIRPAWTGLIDLLGELANHSSRGLSSCRCSLLTTLTTSMSWGILLSTESFPHTFYDRSFCGIVILILVERVDAYPRLEARCTYICGVVYYLASWGFRRLSLKFHWCNTLCYCRQRGIFYVRRVSLSSNYWPWAARNYKCCAFYMP